MPQWNVPQREQKQLVMRAPSIGITNLGRAASRAAASASARAAREAATSCSRAWASATVIEAWGRSSPSSVIARESSTDVPSADAAGAPFTPRTAAATPPASSALSSIAGRRGAEPRE